jgi:VIT1/CCC1 family predicted Fe2+/Mn2+ transporter
MPTNDGDDAGGSAHYWRLPCFRRPAAVAGSAPPHPHAHYSHRAPWLRAAVLGAMDGVGSIASLLMGVQGGSASAHTTLLAGASGAVAGALSMGVSEYVSVSSQRDAEAADVRAEAAEQAKGPAARAAELAELARIYEARGCPPALAADVAAALSARNVVEAHARDELGIDPHALSNPLLAALSGAGSFIAGAALPLLAAGVMPTVSGRIGAVIGAATVGFLAAGAASATLGGASVWVGMARVTLGGWLELAATYGIGVAIGTGAGA